MDVTHLIESLNDAQRAAVRMYALMPELARGLFTLAAIDPDGVAAVAAIEDGRRPGMVDLARRLAAQGYLRDGVASWAAEGRPLEQVRRIGVDDLASNLRDIQVIDVRRPSEWNEGHVAGARSHPLDSLRKTVCSIDRSRPAAVHCKSGYRSAIAASLLQAEDFREVIDVAGGFDAWKARGLPVVTGPRA